MRSASDHGLSLHIMPTSISRWHMLCQFIFFRALRAFLSVSYCAEEPTIVFSYIDSSGRSTISALGPSRVSRMIFFFAKSAIYIALSISPSEEEGQVLVYPRKRLSQELNALLLTAPCRTLLLLSSYSKRGCVYIH